MNNVRFVEETHQYFIDDIELPSVHKILELNNLIDYGFLNEEERKRFFDRGKAIHKACQYYSDGELIEDALHIDLRGFLAGYKKFLDEWMISNIEWGKPIMGYGYAGFYDFIADVNRGGQGRTLIEIKSGKALSWVWYQLALYAIPLGISILGYVELHKDGTYTAVFREFDTELEDDTNAILRVANIKQRMKG